MFTVLVQPGGQADGVGKTQTHDFHRIIGDTVGDQTIKMQRPGNIQSPEGDAVGDLRRQAKQRRAGQGVEHRASVYPSKR